ncbi:MAG: hypothetical protein JJW01_02315 [Alphaproteobacteria bacterium]|nr:hypothetical protein [Rickettsiales bacterium]
MNTTNITYIVISGLGTDELIWDDIFNHISISEPSKLIKIPFWHLLNYNKREEVREKINNCVGAKMLLGWSVGSLLLVKYFKYFIQESIATLLVSFTPRMLEDDGYVGYKNIIFNKMKADLLEDKSKFLQKFIKNITSFSNNINRKNHLLNTALNIDTNAILQGLHFLQLADLRQELNDLLNQQDSVYAQKNTQNSAKKENSHRIADKVYFLHGKKDSIMPFANFNLNKGATRFTYIDNNNCTKMITNKIKLQCGHDVLFEEKELLANIITTLLSKHC